MKHLWPYPLFLIIFLIVAGCNRDKEDPLPEPMPSEPSIEFEDKITPAPVMSTQGGTTALTFTAAEAWTADVNAITRALDWVSVSPTSGEAGTVNLQITAQPNETYDDRNAAIVLQCGSTKKTITLTQKQKDALLITSQKMELEAKGGEFDIKVQANVSFSYEIGADGQSWLSAVTTRGLTTSTLRFTATANEDTETRQAVITIKGGDFSEEVTVYQAGSDPAIVLSQKDYTVTSAGKTITVELKSNTMYKVVMPSDAPWISEATTRSFSAYTHYYTIAPNDTYNARSAEIVFVDENNPAVADTLTITQVQLDAILVAKNEYSVDRTGGMLSFDVNTNVDFSVTVAVDWIHQVTTKGLTTETLTFNIDANESEEAREAIITIAYGDLKQEITVNQGSIAELQREALLAFYKAAGGDQWKENTNWCSDKPLSEWYGIKVNGNNQVYGIWLGQNNLSGDIAKAIEPLVQLQDLTELNLEDNNLSNKLPQSIGNMTNLRALYLGSNNLTGDVSGLSKLSFLQILDLSNNAFSENLPEIASDNLRYFYANNNQFTGSIPESHAKFAEKITGSENNGDYNVSYNNLTGNISQAFTSSCFFKYGWSRILLQNAGYGFGQVEIPAPDNRVQCYDGSFLDLKAEYIKNTYTLILRGDIHNFFSAPYPELIANLYNKYKDKGFGVLGSTYYKCTEKRLTTNFTSYLPEAPLFWESDENNPSPYSETLFGFSYNPLMMLIDNQGHIIFLGETNGSCLPQHHTNWMEIFDFVAQLYGDQHFDPYKFYTSTDYSRDGEVVTLQQASAGQGIDIVFMGEGFVDRDMGDNGKYEQVMIEAMEQFFAFEPFTTFRNRFNVYAVKVVSPNESFLEGAEHRINNRNEICFEYAMKATNQTPRVTVVYNHSFAGRSRCAMWNDGAYVAYMMESMCEVLNHEIGHGFGRLNDEYVEPGYENVVFPADEYEFLDNNYTDNGLGANTDWRKDPATVRWAHLLNDSRYDGEQLGIYEGALKFGLGIYRPTENSMMRYNDSPFNAPSREQIYKRIMQNSEGDSWTYDYEQFVSYDAVNRNYVTTRTLSTPASPEQIAKWKKSHHPPILMKGSWRDVMK